jgi:signal recognition particle subunit SRP54
LNASRKKRVASGSGTSVQDINRLVKQQKQMATMMKKMRKGGMAGMMKQMKGLMGGKMDDLEMLAGSMNADDLPALDQASALGPNPFATGAMPTGMGDLSSLLGGKKK